LEVSFVSIHTWVSVLTKHFTSDILRIMRKLRPNEKIIDDYADDNVRDVSTVDNARGNEILKGFGKSGFTSLEESVKGNIEGL
jgi:hypothetical protein